MIRGIVGTGGHIDHGKTALVEALTGVRTDRLPEEQRRGITIDLGFAHLDLDGDRAGLIDVPGHEDFIRNMVAGASGFDLLLLVVAADEGVMPQTREHVAIAGMLGVPAAVVALTKTDLVEPAWLELAADDVSTFLADTPFADTPIVPTSAITGDGLDTLRAAIGDALPGARGRPEDLFRLPVDRVFTVHGTGTVVTGTVWTGSLRPDARVRVLPGDRSARVRTLQVHGAAVDAIGPGQRAAVALVGLDREDAGRGTTLVADPAWEATTRLTARLRVLPASDWSIDHGQRLRVHLGTAEVMGRAFLLDAETLDPGAEGWAQLRLEVPIVARCGDRLVLRSYSPVTTIGGGTVAEPLPRTRRKLREGDADYLDALTDPDDERRLDACLRHAGGAGVQRDQLPVLTGTAPPVIEAALDRLGAVGTGELVFEATVLADLRDTLLDALARYHDRYPLHPDMDPEQLRRAAPRGTAEPLVARGLADLIAENAIVARNGRVALPGFAPRLDPQQQARKDRLLQALEDAGCAPPRVDELLQQMGGDRDLPDLVALLEADGSVLRLDHEMVIHAGHVQRLTRDIRARFAGRDNVSPAEFRDVVPASRRHLIPILEYLDRVGVTVRKGDGRSVPAGVE